MLTIRHSFAALALSLVTCSTGCFDDPAANDTSTTNSEDSASGTDGGACPDGSAGCACYGNDTCDAELECIGGTCKLPECVPGSLNCDCYEGVCLTGLLCMEGVCKPEDAMMGCESVADCDGNLCTQGDALCEGACQPGVEVQCPLGATCDQGSGSCQCGAGSKPCGNTCIPETQCCMDSDCGGGSTCQDGFCTCEGGLVCGGECLAGANCCPGEVTFVGCNCGNSRVCSREGMWSQCTGGNPDPKCVPGQISECGDKCGSSLCTAQCEWTNCQGEGDCTPGQETCTMAGTPLLCTFACFWTIVEDGGKCD
jgi:hypothetical protein